jgi:hypothetical protein
MHAATTSAATDANWTPMWSFVVAALLAASLIGLVIRAARSRARSKMPHHVNGVRLS